MTTHIMLDLETLGNNSHAAIISIGAAAVDPWGKTVEQTFHQGVNLDSAFKYGRIDASTLYWWLAEDRNEARNAWLESEGEDLDNVIDGFTTWFNTVTVGEELPCVWGNGATFDNVILRNAYKAVGYDTPWGHTQDRCFRTLKNMTRMQQPTFNGVRHDAVSDAIHQALWLQKIVKKLKLEVL